MVICEHLWMPLQKGLGGSFRFRLRERDQITIQIEKIVIQAPGN